MAKTILLADDSVTIRKVVELTFMDEDYEVVAVASGDEALEQLDTLAPDIIIADIHMPGAGGYEVARVSKSKRPTIPVLLLVGTFEQFDVDDVAACGAEGHLKKPFDSQELLRMVDELLSAARAPEPEPLAPELEASFSFDDEPIPDLVAPPAMEQDAAPVFEEPDIAPFDDAILSTLEPSIESGDSPFGEPVSAGPLAEATEVESSFESIPYEEPVEQAHASEELEEAQVRETFPDTTDEEPAAAAFEPEEIGELSDDDVDRIARRVVEYLTDDVVRDLAWEILPDLAEIIVKARLRELEGQIE